MSHVSCGKHSATASLAECYFTLSASSFLNSECERGDDVYVDCTNSDTSAIDNAELDIALAQHDDANQQRIMEAKHREFDAQASSVPSSVVVVSLDTNATIVAASIASLVSQIKSVVTIASAASSTTYVKRDGNVSTLYTFGYFTVSFTAAASTPAPAAGSDTGGTTEAPVTVTADAIMTTFLACSSSALLAQHIYELRPASQASYGTIADSASLKFSLEVPSTREKFGTVPSDIGFGYLRSTASENSAFSNVCNVSTDNQNRYITASWVCGALGFTTIPSMLIPYFGDYNLGYMGMSQLQRVSSGYARVASPFFSKSNNCSNSDSYGIICGSGNFEAGTTDPPQQQFCVLTTIYQDGFTKFTTNVYRELLIPPYRIRKMSDDGGKLCFRFQAGYDFKDTSPTVDFTIVDLQYMLSSINTAGWLVLTGSQEVYEITITTVATMVQPPVQPVEVTLMTNLTTEVLIQEILSYFSSIATATLIFVDAVDIVLVSNETIFGTLPKKPAPTTAAPPTTTVAPTSIPTPPTPRPTRWNKKNRTMTHTAELTLTEEQTTSSELTLTENPKQNRSTTAAPTGAPTTAPDQETVNLVTLRFMFAAPAFTLVSLVDNKTFLAWSVFTYGAPQVITPAPPPPDQAPLITGLVFAGLILVALIVVAAVVVKKFYYTRTPKRWDDDYVMMNTQVLTIPLNTIEMETPVRRSTRAKEVDTADRDTADLF
jgi:hypothetical protein